MWIALVILVALGGTGFLGFAWEPAMGLVPPPDRSSFDRDVKERGAELARLGNCNTCHESPQGKAYAGGRVARSPCRRCSARSMPPISRRIPIPASAAG